MKLRPTREFSHLHGLLCDLFDFPQQVDLPREGIRWKKWLALVEDQRLAPLVFSRCRDAVPDALYPDLALLYNRNAGLALSREMEILELSRLLQGLDVMLLKGAALEKQMYEEAAHREMWDIDVLFRTSEEAEEAHRRILSSGYSVNAGYLKNFATEHQHHLPPLLHPVKGTAVELHTNIWTPPTPDAFMTELWEQKQPAPGLPGNLCLPGPEALLVHTACHAMADPVESPLLRNLLETAFQARALADRGDAVAALSDRGGLKEIVARALWMAHDLFGTPALIEPRPREGFFEFWSARRLSWCPPRHPAARFRRHVAARHCDELIGGADPNRLGVLGGVIHRTVKQVTKSWREQHVTLPSGPLVQGDMLVSNLGEGQLLLDRENRNTHLLDQDAAIVWQQVDGQRSAADVIREAGKKEVERGKARSVLHHLLGEELIRSTAAFPDRRTTAR